VVAKAGEGTYGIVYKAVNKKDPLQVVAIKEMRHDDQVHFYMCMHACVHACLRVCVRTCMRSAEICFLAVNCSCNLPDEDMAVNFSSNSMQLS